MAFKPYYPDGETKVTRQNLPHWRQDGVTYFVTSRLADAMPASVLSRWNEERQAWLHKHHLKSYEQVSSLSKEKQQEFQRIFTAEWHRWLDAGHGDCVLKDAEIARMLVDEMVKGVSEYYDLDAWVVMPNHFHGLVSPNNGVSLSKIMQGWKGASARAINLRLNRTGVSLWQDEPFDHIVRSEVQLNHFRRYIAENPVEAGLKKGSFALGFSLEELSPSEFSAKVAGTSVPDDQVKNIESRD